MAVPKRFAPLLFVLLMALSMAAIISFVLTLVNAGAAPDLLPRWLRAFGLGFAVAFPTALGMVPLVRKAVDRLTQ